jgi:hypothetical protein
VRRLRPHARRASRRPTSTAAAPVTTAAISIISHGDAVRLIHRVGGVNPSSQL